MRCGLRKPIAFSDEPNDVPLSVVVSCKPSRVYRAFLVLKVLYRHGTISIIVINMGLSRDTPLTYTERFTYRTLVVANVLYRHWTISFIGFYKGLSRDAAFTYTERFLYRTFDTISALPCTTRCHTATPNIPSVLKDRHGTINVFVNN